MSEANSDRVLLSLPSGEDGEVRVSLNTFNGQQRVDFRRYWIKDGEAIATKKGTALPLDAVPALLDALLSVLAAGVDDPEVVALRERAGATAAPRTR